MSELDCTYRPGDDDDWIVSKKDEEGASEWVANVVSESLAEMVVFCMENSQLVEMMINDSRTKSDVKGAVNNNQ